jgi:Asp-tRNA(Asn)/Glu-tRNA(Gln) amidotransferase B subunit
MLDGGGSAREIVDREGLAQVSDDGALLSWVTDVVQAYPEQGAQFRDGNEKVVGFLVGAIMKASGGKANPQRARELLVEQLRAAE